MVGLISSKMLFISCARKEGVSLSSTNGSNAVIENSPKSAGSAWTYGEPAYYDEFGLPRWSDEYPRIMEKYYDYFYTKNDWNIITKEIPCDCDIELAWSHWSHEEPPIWHLFYRTIYSDCIYVEPITQIK